MKKIFFLLTLGAMFLLSSCSNSDDNDTNAVAKLSVRLTDSPACYEEVLVDIQDVRVHFDGDGDEGGGWQMLEGVNSGIYNLLDFTNGADTLIAEEEFTAGTISQVRLVLGENNQVKIDGVYYDLATPSAQQSGLKLNYHAELEPGVAYSVWLDFDAGRSVVAKGNGSYSLKPVMRIFTEATSGAITGTVMPLEANPYVNAISADADTFSTYVDTVSGYFLIRALPEGDFKVKFSPAEGYQEKEIEEVEVTNGNVTDVGVVTIDEEIL